MRSLCSLHKRCTALGREDIKRRKKPKYVLVCLGTPHNDTILVLREVDVRTTIACIVATLLCQAAFAERGYDRFRKLRVQANLYESLDRLDRAAETLVEAYDAFPDESVLLDAAIRFERAGQHQHALLILEKYFSVSRSPAGRVTARAAYTRVRAQMDKTCAEIRITTDPPDSEVCIGEDHSNCMPAPVRTWLDHGSHSIRVHHPGLASRTYNANINAGKYQRIQITLQPHVAAGRIEVFSSVQGAVVQLDGREIGATPLVGLSVPAGEHSISVSQSPAHVWSQSITVHPGRTTTLYAGVAPPDASNSTVNKKTLLTPEPVVVQALEIPEPSLSTPLPVRTPDAGAADARAISSGARVVAAAPAEPEGSGIGRGTGAPIPVVLPSPTAPPATLPEPPAVSTQPIASAPLPAPIEPPPVEVAPVDIAAAPPTEPPLVEEPPATLEEPLPEEAPIAPELPEGEVPLAEAEPVPEPAPADEPLVLEAPMNEEEPLPLEESPQADMPVGLDETEPAASDIAVAPATEPRDPEDSVGTTMTLDMSEGPSWMPVTGWSTLGVGIGALGGAVATSFLTQSKVDDIRALYDRPDSTNAERDALRAEAKDLQLITNILYPVGGAFVAAGITLLVLDMMSQPGESSPGDTMQLGAIPLRDGGMLIQTTIGF